MCNSHRGGQATLELSSSEEISPHRGRGSSSGPENRGARAWGCAAADAAPSCRLTGGGVGWTWAGPCMRCPVLPLDKSVSTQGELFERLFQSCFLAGIKIEHLYKT